LLKGVDTQQVATAGVNRLFEVFSKTPVWFACAVLCTLFVCATSCFCVVIISISRVFGGIGGSSGNINSGNNNQPSFGGINHSPYAAQPFPYSQNFVPNQLGSHMHMHRPSNSGSGYSEREIAEQLLYMAQAQYGSGMGMGMGVGVGMGTGEESTVGYRFGTSGQPQTQVGNLVQHLSLTLFRTIPHKIAENFLRFVCFVSFGLGCHPMVKHGRQRQETGYTTHQHHF
jgi:hypothetical protein